MTRYKRTKPMRIVPLPTGTFYTIIYAPAEGVWIDLRGSIVKPTEYDRGMLRAYGRRCREYREDGYLKDGIRKAEKP